MKWLNTLGWYLIKLPAIIVLMALGFVLESAISLPFAVAYYLTRSTDKKVVARLKRH